MQLEKSKIVLLSPLLIILINTVIAILFGRIIGKWAFVPIILIEWCLFIYFIIQYGGKESIKAWLKKPTGHWGWSTLALLIGFLPLQLFLAFSHTLSSWMVWLPWILLALINPWIEEFYWRGLLLDYTRDWKNWISVLYTTFFFSMNHAVFGINSELSSGPEVIISTFILGVVWAIVYQKTGSLRWCILAHFLVDFFNLSVPSFLDLYERTLW